MCSRYLSQESRYNNLQMLCLITFGSPRVGNSAFRNAIQARVGEAWRCVCENDVVPSLPYEDMSSVARMASVLCGCCLCCCVPPHHLKAFGELPPRSLMSVLSLLASLYSLMPKPAVPCLQLGALSGSGLPLASIFSITLVSQSFLVVISSSVPLRY